MAEKLLSTGFQLLIMSLREVLIRTLVYLMADLYDHGRDFLYQFIQQRPSYYVNTERKMEYI